MKQAMRQANIITNIKLWCPKPFNHGDTERTEKSC